MALFVWVVAFATLFLGVCSANRSLYASVEPTSVKANENFQTLEPSKPRPIEEWTDPNDQELARHLIELDEHRRILISLFNDVWNLGKKVGGHSTASASQSNLELISLFHKKLASLMWYPPIAARNGWEGVVHLDVILRETGEIVAVRVFKSSGYPVLDHSATDMVREAGPLTIKEPLEHPVVFLRVPVRYGRR
jgi:TonB family protein